MADEVLAVTVAADTGNTNDALKEVAQGVKDLKDQVSEVREGLKSFKDAFLSAFTVDKVIEFFSAMTESATAVEKLTATLGVSAQTLDLFDFSGRAVGVSVSAMSESFTRIERTVMGAQAGVARAKDTLADLGLRAKDFVGLNAEQKFDLIAGAVSKFRDGTEKTAAVTALMGSAGAALIPILNQGAGAFRELEEAQRRAGSDASKEFLAEMGRLDIQTIEFSKSMSAVGQTIATAFGPAMTGLMSWLSGLAQAFNNSLKEGGLFGQMLDFVVVTVKVLVSTIAAVTVAIQGMWEIGKAVVYGLGELFMGLGKIIYNAFTFNWDGIKDAFNQMTANMVARTQMVMGAIAKDTQTGVDTLNKIWSRAEESQARDSQTQNMNRRRTNQDTLNAILRNYETEIRASQELLKQRSAILDMEVSLGQITQNTKYRQLQEFTEQSYQEQLKILQNELAVGGLKEAQYAAINGRIRQLQMQHNTDMINLDRQSVQAQMAIWRQYTDSVAGSINGQMRGLITGQLSFAQASKNILLDLSLKTIELLVTKPVSEYIAGQLALLTANQTGAAARAATEVAAAGTALPAKVASFTSDITARAALTFAGVFANLSPILGPLASGPAAASEASVMAQLAAVPKFDVGAWSVPRTGLAVIHKDEAILPAGAPAEAYRSGMTGGGRGGVQFVIQAWDGGSVDAWLRSGGAAKLSKAVSGYQDKNPSTRNQR